MQRHVLKEKIYAAFGEEYRDAAYAATGVDPVKKRRRELRILGVVAVAAVAGIVAAPLMPAVVGWAMMGGIGVTGIVLGHASRSRRLSADAAAVSNMDKDIKNGILIARYQNEIMPDIVAAAKDAARCAKRKAIQLECLQREEPAKLAAEFAAGTFMQSANDGKRDKKEPITGTKIITSRTL